MTNSGKTMKKRKTNKQSLHRNVEYRVQLAHPPPPPSQLAINPQYYNTDCSLLILRYLNLIFLLCRKHFNFSNQRFFPSCNAGDLESAPILVRKSDDSQQYDMEWHTAAACPLASKWGTNCRVFDDDIGEFWAIPGKEANFVMVLCRGRVKPPRMSHV